VVGAAGLLPTLRAVETGRRVCLANKEALVVAGEVIMAAAASSGAEIIPIDSEHSAIHQCLRCEDRRQVRRLVLTASGGPFLDRSSEEMRRATPAEALAHPNWSMGDKISIDSATLMNKGLEVVEAHWLFGFGPESISVIIHPQSIIHSMIETVDGSYIAQLGPTDMRHAIRYAITYPERRSCLATDGFDPAQMGPLTFDEPDRGRFPCLQLAFDALDAGGTVPAALNAANEVAVDAFLAGRIRFTEIAEVNRAVMNEHPRKDAGDLANVLKADRVSRQQAASIVAKLAAAGAAVPV
jgi:1-deoxy-D-xylulose-5-phosphate reductoisomerase